VIVAHGRLAPKYQITVPKSDDEGSGNDER